MRKTHNVAISRLPKSVSPRKILSGQIVIGVATHVSSIPVQKGKRPRYWMHLLLMPSVLFSEAARFHCKVCLRGLSTKRSLQRHMMVHTRLRPLVCPECGTGVRDDNTLKAHMLMHSDAKYSALLTTSAESSGRTQSAGEQRHECPTCDKHFDQRSKLNKHMVIHSDER